MSKIYHGTVSWLREIRKQSEGKKFNPQIRHLSLSSQSGKKKHHELYPTDTHTLSFSPIAYEYNASSGKLSSAYTI